MNILCNELSKYEWDGTDYLLDVKLPNDIGLLDKSKMNYIYKEGYTQTKSRIREIKYKLKLKQKYEKTIKKVKIL